MLLIKGMNDRVVGWRYNLMMTMNMNMGWREKNKCKVGVLVMHFSVFYMHVNHLGT